MCGFFQNCDKNRKKQPKLKVKNLSNLVLTRLSRKYHDKYIFLRNLRSSNGQRPSSRLFSKKITFVATFALFFFKKQDRIPSRVYVKMRPV